MNLTDLKGIGPKTAQLFYKLSVYTAEDLVTLYPRTYDVYEEPIFAENLADSAGKPAAAVEAVVVKTPSMKAVRNLKILTTELKDAHGSSLRATWFNMPYLRSRLYPGYRYIFRGRAVFKGKQWVMEQPALFTPDAYNRKLGVLQPVYPLTKGLSNKIVSKAMEQALAIQSLSEEYLPAPVRKRYCLADRKTALCGIHFPEDGDVLEAAIKRLKFEEFFLFILNVRRMKAWKETSVNRFVIAPSTEAKKLIQRLPYRLTDAQEKALCRIQEDMQGERLMNRLIQGDVGSGKTIVAVIALLNAVCAGFQGAMMAPTEVLAKQQYDNICKLFAENEIDVEVSLLIGSMTAAAKKAVRERVASGGPQIIIGTHALIQKKVVFQKLGLVIVDEQHRFGVKQRECLAQKGDEPHVLVMSATPIPRTLAMILYGDLDISVINELPSSRLPVKNCVVGTDYRPNAYRFIEREVRQGRQAYVICPMVAAGENGDILEDNRGDSYADTNLGSVLENVIDYAGKLSKHFPPEIQVAYLHGKMKSDEKNAVMERFYSGEIDVLVSTTVIEVGVNVPNATVMMIENAERFGLAQLHQLRGRVGRGASQSYCIFVTGSNAKQENIDRLHILRDSNDGFKIAEEDLKLRGPGDFFGIRQSGDMRFALADIYSDAAILQDAAEAAATVLQEDPELSTPDNAALCERLKRWGERTEAVL